MTETDKNLIQYLTNLSRIDCNEAEQESLLMDLKEVISYIETLQEIDTEGVAPCDHVLSEIHNVFREDEIGTTLETKKFLDNSPDQIGGMIRVPTVIKKK